MRTDGFERMDVSTSIDDDPKFRLLARRYPEHYATALAAYVGLLARSWREGERLTLEEGWPSLLPWEDATAAAMQEAQLVDSERRLPDRAWRAWYGAAAERRQLGRERQKRADARRGRAGSQSPSTHRQTGSTDSPSDSQTGPMPGQRKSNVGPSASTQVLKGRTATARVPSEGPCGVCGGHLSDTEPCRVGPGFIEHSEHPPEWIS